MLIFKPVSMENTNTASIQKGTDLLKIVIEQKPLATISEEGELKKQFALALARMLELRTAQ